MKLRNFFVVVLAGLFAFTSCDNFLGDNGKFLEKFSEEVHDSTAKVLNVKVQALPGQGNASCTTATVKLGVTFMVNFELDSSYGYFIKWKAYADYEKPSQKELTAEDVLFSNETSLLTEVTILKEYSDIRIIPTCSVHPRIIFNVPKDGDTEAGAIDPMGAVQMPGNETHTIVARMNDLYSFGGWVIKKGEEEVALSEYFDIVSDNVNSRKTDATLKLKIKAGKDVNDMTITAKANPRPKVRDTSPSSNAVSVSRTTSIILVFTKKINKDFVSEENYKKYFSIERRDAMTSYESNKVFEKFLPPTISDDGLVVTFEPADKLHEENWLSPTSYITVTVEGDLEDADGILLGNPYTYSFTFGTSGDTEGPIISSASLVLNDGGIERPLTAVGSEQAYWGDWMPNSGVDENHTYADSFRIKAAEGQKFSAQMTANDETTGNTGIKSYSVIQRLMYVPKGGRLPVTTRIAETDMTLFAADGSWNGLSGCLKADFEKEIELEADGDRFKEFEFAEFKDANDEYVDGIYMFELTARDKLGNKSGNPARYFVVRDTTAPNASENVGKISFGNCGVELYGEKYFGGNYKQVVFNFAGELVDVGTQGQPGVASCWQ